MAGDSLGDGMGWWVLRRGIVCWHNAVMPVQITIRNVPEEVRDELAALAAHKCQSMQEFLRGELERIASRPSIDTWLQVVRERKAVYKTRVTSDDILRVRDEDRKWRRLSTRPY